MRYPSSGVLLAHLADNLDEDFVVASTTHSLEDIKAMTDGTSPNKTPTSSSPLY